MFPNGNKESKKTLQDGRSRKATGRQHEQMKLSTVHLLVLSVMLCNKGFFADFGLYHSVVMSDSRSIAARVPLRRARTVANRAVANGLSRRSSPLTASFAA